MKIIPATMQNLDEIFSINQELTPPIPISPYPWNKIYWIQKQVREGSFVIAKKRIIYGAMCLFHALEDSEESYIETIAIRKDKQRGGVGRSLVEFAAQQAREKGKKKLIVESFCFWNAKDFYLKCGFKLAPELGSYRGQPAYSFSMTL